MAKIKITKGELKGLIKEVMALDKGLLTEGKIKRTRNHPLYRIIQEELAKVKAGQKKSVKTQIKPIKKVVKESQKNSTKKPINEGILKNLITGMAIHEGKTTKKKPLTEAQLREGIMDNLKAGLIAVSMALAPMQKAAAQLPNVTTVTTITADTAINASTYQNVNKIIFNGFQAGQVKSEGGGKGSTVQMSINNILNPSLGQRIGDNSERKIDTMLAVMVTIQTDTIKNEKGEKQIVKTLTVTNPVKSAIQITDENGNKTDAVTQELTVWIPDGVKPIYNNAPTVKKANDDIPKTSTIINKGKSQKPIGNIHNMPDSWN